MRQIVQNMRTGEMSVQDVPPPQLGRGEVLVATKASLISAGTEKMLIDFANKSMLSKAQERPDLVKKVVDKMQRDGVVETARSVFSRLEEPLPLGYSASGEVIAVGEGLTHLYKEGDRVAVAGAGIANHAEINAVPKNLIAKIPDNVPYDQAAYTTVSAIAMQGFRNSGAVLGDRVLVMGLGLIGQITAQLAQNAGCQVMGMEFSQDRLDIAIENGIQKVCNLAKENPDALVTEFTEGKGFDSIIICAATDSNGPIIDAARWARDRANIVMTGKVGTEIPYADFMKKELNFVISRSYGPGRYDKNYENKGQDYPIGYVRWTERDNMEDALRLMSTGGLNVTSLTSHNFPIEEAEDAYGLVLAGDIPSLGVVLTYSAPTEQRLASKVNLRPTEVVTESTLGMAMLGAGGFARAVLLPRMKKLVDTQLTGILTKGGMSAGTTGKKWGFNYAASDVDDILRDEKTHAVVIATRHDSHAGLVMQALKASKHVFVEKPLAMTLEDLKQVQETYLNSGKALMVGFNRRYSPFVKQMQEQLSQVKSPRQVLLRVNAGMLEGDNWQNDPSVGGGRLLGEACHFVDLALCLMNSEPTQVFATQGKGQDNYAVTISGKDGSTAQIFYTSEGDSSQSKERVEVYAGGMVGVIDNFRNAFTSINGKKTKLKAKGQDKGHAAELELFAKAVRGEETNLDTKSMFVTSKVTLLIAESIQSNTAVKVD